MFLTKKLSELEQLTNPESHVMQEYDILKKYLTTRLQMDEDLKSFNDNQTTIKADIKQNLSEDYMSYQRVIAAITMFKKFNSYDSDIKESVDNIYSLIISDLSAQYKYFYIESEILLKQSIEKILEMNEEKIQFKENQKLELDILKNEIYDCGFIPKVLNNVYTNIKLSISSYTALCGSRYNMYISEEMKDFQNNLEYLMTDVFLHELKRLDILDTETQFQSSIDKYKPKMSKINYLNDMFNTELKEKENFNESKD